MNPEEPKQQPDNYNSIISRSDAQALSPEDAAKLRKDKNRGGKKSNKGRRK